MLLAMVAVLRYQFANPRDLQQYKKSSIFLIVEHETCNNFHISWSSTKANENKSKLPLQLITLQYKLFE